MQAQCHLVIKAHLSGTSAPHIPGISQRTDEHTDRLYFIRPPRCSSVNTASSVFNTNKKLIGGLITIFLIEVVNECIYMMNLITKKQLWVFFFNVKKHPKWSERSSFLSSHWCGLQVCHPVTWWISSLMGKEHRTILINKGFKWDCELCILTKQMPPEPWSSQLLLPL